MKNINFKNVDILENLKILATDFGFIDCKILDLQSLYFDENFQKNAEISKKNFENLVEKIAQNALLNNGLHYLTAENTKQIRYDFSANLLLPNAKFLLIFALPYVGKLQLQKYLQNPPKVALHAVGRDYHKIVRSKLKQFWNLCCQKFFDNSAANFRIFCDSTPILEKFFAQICELGWLGKNNLITNKHYGNLFVIGGIITTLELDKYIQNGIIKTPKFAKNHCGKCQKCIQNCPTQALQIDKNQRVQFLPERCLAFYLNEFHGESAEIPPEIRSKSNGKIYGCDDCISVCPFNRFVPSDEFISKDFADKFNQQNLQELLTWNENDFLKNTEGSGLRRLGFARWRRNLLLSKK